MHDVRARVIQVRFTSEPDARSNRAHMRYAAVVWYPLDIKRMLATVTTAKGRAVKLARGIIQRRCYRPPDLDTLHCTVEVTLFDLRPFAERAWIQDDGTNVFLTEVERPLPSDWGWCW